MCIRDSPTSSILHITKLNLEDLPGTPIVTDTKNVEPENHTITLSPNPAASTTNLLYTGPTLTTARLELLDTYGQIVREMNLNHLNDNASIQIETQNITNGLYFVSLSNGKDITTTQKLVVSH